MINQNFVFGFYIWFRSPQVREGNQPEGLQLHPDQGQPGVVSSFLFLFLLYFISIILVAKLPGRFYVLLNYPPQPWSNPPFHLDGQDQAIPK